MDAIAISQIIKPDELPVRTAANVYDSLPISEGKIRLFRFNPGPDLTSPVTIDIFTAKLEGARAPPYDALSYEWGNSAATQTISFNGAQLAVRENLYDALCILRDGWSASGYRNFWIDGICINQSSVPERNKQIRLMGKIYAQAHTVRIWIGKEYDNAKEGMVLVARLAALDHDVEAIYGMRYIKTEVEALTKLVQRSYWQRMWVFQEVVLSQSAEVHCGALHCFWDGFKRLDRVSAGHMRSLWLEVEMARRWMFELRKAVSQIASFCVPEARAGNRRNILLLTRHLKCQDPRDKLYGLSGLCPQIVDQNLVGYDLPVRHVYTEFAKGFIEEEKGLSLLLTADLWEPANGPDMGLPTWVPDLRGNSGVDIHYTAESFSHDIDNMAEHFSGGFNADGMCGQSPGINFQQEGEYTILLTQGFIVDVIGECIAFPQDLRGDESIRRAFLNRLAEVLTFKSAQWLSRMADYVRIMMFDLSLPPEQDIEFEDFSRTHRRRRLVLGFADDLGNLFAGGRELARSILKFFEKTEEVPTLLQNAYASHGRFLDIYRQQYLDRAEETTGNGVSAMLMTRGNRLGVGPRRMQQGDVVAILEGSRVPLVLRRDGLYFELVGPCYINTLMQGEGVGPNIDGEGGATIQTIGII